MNNHKDRNNVKQNVMESCELDQEKLKDGKNKLLSRHVFLFIYTYMYVVFIVKVLKRIKWKEMYLIFMLK